MRGPITRSAGFIEHTLGMEALVRLRFDRDAAQRFATSDDDTDRRRVAGREVDLVQPCCCARARREHRERSVVQVADVEVCIGDACHAQAADRVELAGVR